MKRNEYLRKEWRDNKPVVMEEKRIDEIVKNQAAIMRDIDNNMQVIGSRMRMVKRALSK